MRAAGASLEWFIDGAPYQLAEAGDTVLWPVTPGRHIFQVRTPDVISHPVVVMVH